MSLRTRFALIFAALIAIMAALLSTAVSDRSAAQLRQMISGSLSRVAYRFADILDRDLATRVAEVKVLAKLDVFHDWSNPAGVRTLIDTVKENIPAYAWIGYTDPDGKVIASTGGLLEGSTIAERPVFANAREGMYLGDVHDATLLAKLLPSPDGTPMKFVDIGMPVRDGTGKLIGVLAVHLSWDWAESVRRSFQASYSFDETTELLVVGADGRVLLGAPGLRGDTINLDPLRDVRPSSPIALVTRWDDGMSYLTGVAMGSGFGGSAEFGWRAVARRPADLAYQPVNEMQRDILAWGLALALPFAGIGWLIAGWIVVPLRRITEAAIRMRNGEQIAMPAARGIREVESLSVSLSALLDSLTRTAEERDKANNRALTDSLTGLPNRWALEQHLDRSLARARRQNSTLTVLALDLDGFKKVNDTLGHQAGDDLLREIGRRLQGSLRIEELVARTGGDEFVVVLETGSDWNPTVIDPVARRLIQAVSRPVTLGDDTVNVGCSIGVAVWPTDGSEIAEVLRLADEALYEAKRRGRGRAVFHQRQRAAE